MTAVTDLSRFGVRITCDAVVTRLLLLVGRAAA